MSGSLYQKAGKLALILAFSASAGSFFLVWFFRAYWDTPLRFISYGLYAPAVLLGCWSYLRVRSFAKAWPVVGCVLWALVAILWTDPTETGRAMILVYHMACVLPIASLIVEIDYTRQCAYALVVISSASLAFLCYLHYGDTINLIKFNVGYLRDAMGGRELANPNAVGNQMGLAVLLSLSFCFGQFRNKDRLWLTTRAKNLLWALVILFLVLGAILTRSREAFVLILLPSYLVIFHSRGYSKRKAAVLFLLILIAAIIPFTVLGDAFVDLGKRFANIEELMTLSDRTDIWRFAMEVLQTDPKNLLIGTGTGSADKALGAEGYYFIGSKLGADGIVRLNAHNTYIEWIISYGFVGFVLGMSLLFAAVKRAWRLDKRQGTVLRRALVLFCVLNAAASVIYRSFLWPALGSLVLAVLTDGGLRGPMHKVGRPPTKSSMDVSRP